MSSIKPVNVKPMAIEESKGEKQARFSSKENVQTRLLGKIPKNHLNHCMPYVFITIPHKWLGVEFESEKNFSQNCFTVYKLLVLLRLI